MGEPSGGQFLSVAEAAEIAKTTSKNIYNWIHLGVGGKKLKAFKPGGGGSESKGHLKIKRDDLFEFLRPVAKTS